MRASGRVRALSKRRVLAPPVLAGLTALLGGALSLSLLAPGEAAPRHVPGSRHACSARRGPRPSVLSSLIATPRAVEPVVEASVAAPASETTASETTQAGTTAPVSSGRYTYSEAWLRGSVVDPDAETDAPRIVVTGRVVRSVGGDSSRGARGAHVRLLATFSEGDPGPEMGGDDLKRVLAGVPAEERTLFRRTLSDDSAAHVVELGVTDTDARGRYVFALDPNLLPLNLRLTTTATLDVGGTPWTAPSSDSESVCTTDVTGLCELTIDSLELVATRRVTVAARAGGAPVAGALVAVTDTSDEDFTGVTDAQGRFELELVGGSAWIRVSKPGLSTRVQRVESGTAGPVVFDLAGVTAVKLHVVDASGAPVEGADYWVSDPNGVVASGNADDKGMASITALAPGGSYTVSASGPDPAQGSGSATIATPVSDVTVQLGTAAVVSVQLVFDGDVPERVRAGGGVTCHLERQGPDGTFAEATSAGTDGSGVCSFGHLYGGTYQVYTTEEKLAPSFSGPFHLDAGGQASLSLGVGYGHDVTAWVLDAQGGRQDASVFVGGTQLRLSTQNGWFEARLPNRGVALLLQKNGFAPVTIDVGPERSHLGEIVLAPGVPGN